MMKIDRLVSSVMFVFWSCVFTSCGSLAPPPRVMSLEDALRDLDNGLVEFQKISDRRDGSGEKIGLYLDEVTVSLDLGVYRDKKSDGSMEATAGNAVAELTKVGASFSRSASTTEKSQLVLKLKRKQDSIPGGGDLLHSGGAGGDRTPAQ